MPAPLDDPARAALLVVDVQRGLDDVDHWGARNNPACEDNIAALIARWRSEGRPLVYIRHDSVEPDSPLAPEVPTVYQRAGWTVDAVEIDSAVTRLAAQEFGFKPFHARVVHADGRRYLATTRERYDLIVFDAYGSASIPFHLVTREAFALAKARLEPGGILALNVEAVGWHHPLVESLGSTLRTSFAHVVVVTRAYPLPPQRTLPLSIRTSPVLGGFDTSPRTHRLATVSGL